MCVRAKGPAPFQWVGQISSISRIAPLFIACLYTAGFIVVQSHIGKRGVVDFSIANTRYLIAGVLFIVFLVIWYLFAGRSIIFLKRWQDQEIDAMKAFHPLWRILILLSSFLRVVFFLGLSVNLYSLLLLREYQSTEFSTFLMVLFLIDYCLVIFKLDQRLPRASQIGRLLIVGTGAVAFHITTTMSPPIVLAQLLFLVMSILVNLMVESYERWEVTREKRIFDFLYASIFIALFASVFGLFQFEYIKSAFGGGQPRFVTIGVKDKYTQTALANMGIDLTKYPEVQLFHESEAAFYFDIGGRMFRLNRDSIAAMEVLVAENRAASVDSLSGT